MRVEFNPNSYFVRTSSVVSKVQTNNSNPIKESENYSNDVNFKGFLEDMVYYFPKKLEAKREARKKEQFKAVEDKIHDDIKLIAARQNISTERAKEAYENSINSVSIPLERYGHEKGLNKVIGYSLEKYQIIKDLLIPLQNVKNDKNVKVPNGVLIYGPANTGKTHFVRALGEHIKRLHLGEFTEVKMTSAIANDDISDIISAFKSAERKYEYSGERQILFFDDLNVMCNEKERPNVTKIILAATKNCSDKGITWIGTTTAPDKLPNILYGPSRLNSDIYFNRTSDAEKSAIMSYCWKAKGRQDNTSHDTILNDYSTCDFHFYPPEFEKVSEIADDYMATYVDKRHKWSGEVEKKPVETSIAEYSINEYLSSNGIGKGYTPISPDEHYRDFVKLKMWSYGNGKN